MSNRKDRKLSYGRIADIWRDGQLMEAEGKLSTEEISTQLGLGSDNWARFKRLIYTANGWAPFGSRLDNRVLAKELLKKLEDREISYSTAFSRFTKHLVNTEQVTPKARRQIVSIEQTHELYRRAVLSVEGSMYAISKLPDWPEGFEPDLLAEHIERLAKARTVLERKINSLRRTTNNA